MDGVTSDEQKPESIFGNLDRGTFNSLTKLWSKERKLEEYKLAYNNLFSKESDLELLLGYTADLPIAFANKDKFLGVGYGRNQSEVLDKSNWGSN